MAGLDRLRMKISEVEARKVFGYMDNDGNGEVSYNEFCELCEEKRRGIDPFENQKNDPSKHKTTLDTQQQY